MANRAAQSTRWPPYSLRKHRITEITTSECTNHFKKFIFYLFWKYLHMGIHIKHSKFNFRLATQFLLPIPHPIPPTFVPSSPTFQSAAVLGSSRSIPNCVSQHPPAPASSRIYLVSSVKFPSVTILPSPLSLRGLVPLVPAASILFLIILAWPKRVGKFCGCQKLPPFSPPSAREIAP